MNQIEALTMCMFFIVIIGAVEYVLLIRRAKLQDLETYEGRFRLQQLIREAEQRWTGTELLDGLDALYKDRGEFLREARNYDREDFHTLRKRFIRDRRLLIAEIARLRTQRLELESGFNIKHAAQL